MSPSMLESLRNLPAPNATLPSALTGSAFAPLVSAFSTVDEGWYSYSGSDMRVMLEVQGSGMQPKQLIQLVTLTVSVHREKSPARALGYINPKGYARGRRTIAGTMILTQFNVDFLYQFLNGTSLKDLSKDTISCKSDQLPPFNLTLLFADEYGNSSYRRVTGVDLITDGVVYSSNDMMSEQSLTYVASDFTPLIPTGRSSIADPTLDPNVQAGQNSVSSVMQKRKTGSLEQASPGQVHG